jgi:hypothetical protein
MNIALLYRARQAFPQAAPEIAIHLGETGARRAALGITGFLLMADGYTYELLEGDFNGVSAAFALVLANPLLSDVEMLSNATIDRRACHQWSHGVVLEESALPTEISAKVRMLHHFATRFGSSQPVLRDFLARIGQDLAASAGRLPKTRFSKTRSQHFALAS